MSEQQTATPVVTYVDECGTEHDEVLAVDVEGVASYSSMPFEGGVKVTAIPVEGYTLVPAEGWSYDPHAGTLSTIITFTDEPCVTQEEQPVPVTPVPPITELPATGPMDDPWVAIAVGLAILAIGFSILALTVRGRRS